MGNTNASQTEDAYDSDRGVSVPVCWTSAMSSRKLPYLAEFEHFCCACTLIYIGWQWRNFFISYLC